MEAISNNTTSCTQQSTGSTLHNLLRSFTSIFHVQDKMCSNDKVQQLEVLHLHVGGHPTEPRPEFTSGAVWFRFRGAGLKVNRHVVLIVSQRIQNTVFLEP